jgi:hypothetical protein
MHPAAALMARRPIRCGLGNAMHPAAALMSAAPGSPRAWQRDVPGCGDDERGAGFAAGLAMRCTPPRP